MKPRMTLYLLSDDAAVLEGWRQSFVRPYYAYALGRSQDLATCESVEMVELETASEAFFSNTLLPVEWRPYVAPGTTVLLPAVIDYERHRLAMQERYLQITRPALRVSDNTDDLMDRSKLPEEFLVSEEAVGGLRRGLHFWPVRGPRVAG